MKDQSSNSLLSRVDYVRFSLNPEEEPLFLNDYRVAAERLEQSDECISYELCRANGPGNLLMRIEWNLSSANCPLSQQQAPLKQFLFSLKTSLKMVAEVNAYAPVNTLGSMPEHEHSRGAERKPIAVHHGIRKSA